MTLQVPSLEIPLHTLIDLWIALLSALCTAMHAWNLHQMSDFSKHLEDLWGAAGGQEEGVLVRCPGAGALVRCQ
eukprot:1160381-Pelagomonas_calceolata.AAC.14